jgi:hypothetical protein
VVSQLGEAGFRQMHLACICAAERPTTEGRAGADVVVVAMPWTVSVEYKFGPLAQLVEQLTLNQRVPGSSPGRPTIPPVRFGASLKPGSADAGADHYQSPDRVLIEIDANVAELVDALDLGSSGATRGSSSLPIRTNVTRAGAAINK